MWATFAFFDFDVLCLMSHFIDVLCLMSHFID
jgi:hypothetical protein